MDPPPSRAMSYHNPDRLLRRFSSMHRALTDTQVVVCVKIRPLNAIEVAASSTVCTQVLGPGALSVQDDNVIGQARTFTLDAVVHADAPQSALYELTARNILTKVFKGFNGCIFAYGQTGAGKTYSMLGSNKDERSEEGIIPRTCRELFSRISQDNGKTYIVKGHFVEIYQEKIIDLMDSNDTTRSVSKLLIRHDKTKKIQNRATINRDPKLARIVQLTEENQTLKAKIEILEHELQVMKDSILKKTSAYAKSTATVSPATSMSVGNKTKCCVIS
jgi:hypothetical protein